MEHFCRRKRTTLWKINLKTDVHEAKTKTIIFMNCAAYSKTQSWCSSPPTKVLHCQPKLLTSSAYSWVELYICRICWKISSPKSYSNSERFLLFLRSSFRSECSPNFFRFDLENFFFLSLSFSFAAAFIVKNTLLKALYHLKFCFLFLLILKADLRWKFNLLLFSSHDICTTGSDEGILNKMKFLDTLKFWNVFFHFLQH